MLSQSLSLTGQSSAPCWFVGAMINRGPDQTDRFIDEGIWEHDFDANSRVLAQVRSMQTGERWSQRLEDTSGELLPDQPVPLLKRRFELTR